jgi:hypothetical protein
VMNKVQEEEERTKPGEEQLVSNYAVFLEL